MKIYVASHCRWAACHVADALRNAGHTIVSTWHDEPFHPTDRHEETERASIAVRDADEVTRADAVALVAGRSLYSGGKFVEVGIAIGQGKPVFVLGHRENMLLWHPSVIAVNEVEELVAVASGFTLEEPCRA